MLFSSTDSHIDVTCQAPHQTVGSARCQLVFECDTSQLSHLCVAPESNSQHTHPHCLQSKMTPDQRCTMQAAVEQPTHSTKSECCDTRVQLSKHIVMPCLQPDKQHGPSTVLIRHMLSYVLVLIRCRCDVNSQYQMCQIH